MSERSSKRPELELGDLPAISRGDNDPVGLAIEHLTERARIEQPEALLSQMQRMAPDGEPKVGVAQFFLRCRGNRRRITQDSTLAWRE